MPTVKKKAPAKKKATKAAARKRLAKTTAVAKRLQPELAAPRRRPQRKKKTEPAALQPMPSFELATTQNQSLAPMGLSGLELTRSDREILLAPFADDLFGLLPDDGTVYLPWSAYAERMNEVFGPAAWALDPSSLPQFDEAKQTANQWFTLFVRRLAVGHAIGEGRWVAKNAKSSKAKALESAHSIALSRICSKRLGMALYLTRKPWQEAFRMRCGIAVRCHAKDGTTVQWRSIHWPPLRGEFDVAPDSPNADGYQAPSAQQRRAGSSSGRKAKNVTPPKRPQLPAGTITGATIRQIEDACEEHSIDEAALKHFLRVRWGYVSRRQILRTQFEEVLAWIRAPYDVDEADREEGTAPAALTPEVVE